MIKRNKKSVNLMVILLITALLVLSGCKNKSGQQDSTSAPEEQSGSAAFTEEDYKEVEEKLLYLEQIVDSYYLDVNGEGPSKDEMKESIYKGYISSLGDIYTEYMDEDTYKAYMESLSGEYKGIGILINTEGINGTPYILKVYKGGTAEKAGIKKGDIIYKVDDILVSTENIYEVIAHIRATEGTVDFTVYRPDDEEYLDFKPEVVDINVPTVDHRMLDDDIGYIEVSAFSGNTAEQLRNALQDLRSGNMKSLILDLRGNAGGLMNVCCNMLDMIIDKGLLVYTVDKNGMRNEYEATTDESLDIPIVVLIDEESASASEVFSGALQSYKKAYLIGKKSFGKGIVQATLELGDGSAMKVTYSKYYLPNDQDIHGVGITPDLEVERGDDEENDLQLKAAIDYLTDK